MLLHVTRDGQKFGPYTPDQVRAYVASGQVLVTDLAWFEGAADWMPLHSVPGLSLALSTPPPPPPHSARLSAVPTAPRGAQTRKGVSPVSHGSCACPQCGGSQTMKVTVAHAQGTSTSIFGGLSQTGGHSGTFGGAVVNQTALAKQLSPPDQPGIGCWSVGILAYVCFQLLMVGAKEGMGWLVGLTLIATPISIVWLVKRNRAKQTPEYERALAEWERSWVCLQCGRIYTP